METNTNTLFLTTLTIPEVRNLFRKELSDFFSNKENILSQTTEQDRWLNLKDLCEYLPSKPTPATVYAWVADSKIPYHKPGGKALAFLKSEIDEFIKGTRGKTSFEIKREAKAYINKK